MEYKGLPFCKTGWNLHMMPIGYLMIEHRLIERMIKLMSDELTQVNKENKIDADFINTAVDFIRSYADKCHHGKEENILFKALYKKKLLAEHKKIMAELIEEHKMGRREVAKLVCVNENYAQGKPGGIEAVKKQMKWLIEFYPKHILKEDKGFFIPSMSYFTKVEQNEMLKEFCAFDSSPIQETYRNIVVNLEHNHEK